MIKLIVYIKDSHHLEIWSVLIHLSVRLFNVRTNKDGRLSAVISDRLGLLSDKKLISGCRQKLIITFLLCCAVVSQLSFVNLYYGIKVSDKCGWAGLCYSFSNLLQLKKCF